MILREAGIPVIAEAADGSEAVAAVLRHRPDVVLMDIRMPEMDGLEATRRILKTQAGSGCRIIMLTTFDLDRYVMTRSSRVPAGSCANKSRPNTLSPRCGWCARVTPCLPRQQRAGSWSGSPRTRPPSRWYMVTCRA
jgi:DNA-binding NarL/FixJ family response regulator